MRRGGWTEREAKRRSERRERRLKEREEGGEVTAVGGVNIVDENWMSPAAKEQQRDGRQHETETAPNTPAPSSASAATADDALDDEADEDGFVSVRSASTLPVVPPKPARAASLSALGSAPAAASSSADASRKSFFSFLSSSSSSSSVPLTLELSELWTPDVSAPFKYRATAKQTVAAHQAAVLDIDCHPSVGLFLTAGRDEVVRVWSVGLGSGELHCGSVYRGHRLPVTQAELLMDGDDDQTGLVGSCDGQLQVWDIETAVCIMQSPFASVRGEGKKGAASREGAGSAAAGGSSSAASASASSSASSAAAKADASQSISCFTYGGHRSLLLGTSVGSLRHLDLRSGLLSAPWRHLGAAQPIAAVRCICRSSARSDSGGPSAAAGSAEGGQWVSTGLSTGEVTVMEARSGVIRLQWRAHEGAVLSLHCVDGQHILSTGADRSLCLWDIAGEEAALKQRLTAQDDSARDGVVIGQDFLCAVGGKVGVAPLSCAANGLDVAGGAGEKRRAAKAERIAVVGVRGSKSRGHLTALAYLPAYRLLLLGGEDGKLMLTV